MGENFCNAPFAALEVTPQGDCRVCCKMPQQSVLRPDGTNYRVNQDGISVIWQSQWMKDFRERFINNERPSECSMCWDDEKAGIVSLRKQLSGMYIHDVHNPKLKNLTLKLSNKCNCACRICSFWLSSLWETEIKKSGRMLDRDVWFIEENSKDKISSEFWNDWQENLKTLDSLLIYGGEPLINDEVLMILRYLVENGLSKKMSLYLNTNGTIMNPDVIGLLYEFKETGLYFSIDDVFDRYNYERWPAKYENIKKDLLELHDTYNRSNVNICLYTSISIFNIFYLHEILEEFKQFPKFTINFDNLIHSPYELSIYGLPENLKDDVEKYLDTVDFSQNWEHPYDVKNIIKNFLRLYKNEYTSEQYINQLDHTLGIDDVRRKQDWKKTFSTLYTKLCS